MMLGPLYGLAGGRHGILDAVSNSRDRKRSEPRRPAGALESEVLAALWAAERPLTPTQVRAELDADLAYTTVMTALIRLYQKGAARRERCGRAYAYAPVLDEAGIAAARMRGVLERGVDRRAVLAHFVGSLDRDDEQTLTDLLRRASGREP